MNRWEAISEETINAFVDDELSLEEMQAFCDAMARDYSLARQVAHIQTLRTLIWFAYGDEMLRSPMRP